MGDMADISASIRWSSEDGGRAWPVWGVGTGGTENPEDAPNGLAIGESAWARWDSNLQRPPKRRPDHCQVATLGRAPCGRRSSPMWHDVETG